MVGLAAKWVKLQVPVMHQSKARRKQKKDLAEDFDSVPRIGGDRHPQRFGKSLSLETHSGIPKLRMRPSVKIEPSSGMM